MPRRKNGAESSAPGRDGRLTRLTYLLFRHPHGLCARELAALCDVSPRQIQYDLKTLQQVGTPVFDARTENGVPYYSILPGHFLPPVHFNLHEATALFVAARLLARYSDENNPLIIQALAKLAGALPDAIAEHVQNTVRSLSFKPRNPTFAAVFETITRGWAERKKVRIWHQANDSDNIHDYVLAPYFIEPSSAGYSTYVIGHSTYFEGLHTFKVERISRAELLDEPFELPVGFDGTELLKNAWGVMYGDDLVEVRLRFAPSATRRVMESVWHCSQQIEACDDGGCTMALRINHTLEIENWLRGWGHQVEVLSPPDLRAKMAAETRLMAQVYEGE